MQPSCFFVFTIWSLFLVWTSTAAEPARVVLAKDGKALLPIVLAEKAAPETKQIASELAKYLHLISQAEFSITNGQGNKGLVLGHPDEFSQLPFNIPFGTGPFAREEYLLRSTPDGVYVLGNSALAISHAAWDLLYHLGYRQYFPGPNWEIVPKETEPSVALDKKERPSFYARRIWYNWGFWEYNEEPYREWCRRNRAMQGFELRSGHVYEAIIASRRNEFEKHPEYLAKIKGERKIRGDDKFCISNPGLRKLVVEWGIEQVKMKPDLDSLSMEPSDGGGWCECEACAALGSVSTRVLLLANEVAEAINRLGHGPKYVGFYAYNQHCAPPGITVHQKVIPSATTAFLTGGLSFDEVLSGWQKMGATMGVYDYLSVVDWDWNLPRGAAASRLSKVGSLIRDIHAKGARFYDAEAGDCWGPAGLGYYLASRVLWDVKESERVPEIVQDFLRNAFGPAEQPMREFYHLLTEDNQRRSPSDLLGRMYRQLGFARAATEDTTVLKRIDDLILYTRYAELYYAYANGQERVEQVLKHAYRIRKTMMVHSYGIWSRLLSQAAAHQRDHPLKVETPYSTEEIVGFLEAGIAKHQPVEHGFKSLEFTRDLVPAMPHLALTPVAKGHFPTQPQERQRYYVWLAEPSSLKVQITVEKVWALRMPKLELFSPSEVSLKPVFVVEDYLPDGEPRERLLTTPYSGLHRAELYDGGDFTRLQWPEGLPVTIESGIDTTDVTSHFRGNWTLYCYVPKGTQVVGGWASRIANWAPRISGKLLAPDGREMLNFDEMEGDGFFKVAVPEGADGKLWKFENNIGQRLLMTIPPYLARCPDELLLPKEVVEADRKDLKRTGLPK